MRVTPRSEDLSPPKIPAADKSESAAVDLAAAVQTLLTEHQPTPTQSSKGERAWRAFQRYRHRLAGSALAASVLTSAATHSDQLIMWGHWVSYPLAGLTALDVACTAGKTAGRWLQAHILIIQTPPAQ